MQMERKRELAPAAKALVQLHACGGGEELQSTWTSLAAALIVCVRRMLKVGRLRKTSKSEN
jgi:hypothetical protein